MCNTLLVIYVSYIYTFVVKLFFTFLLFGGSMAQVKRRKERKVSTEASAMAFAKAVNAVAKPIPSRNITRN